MKSAETLQKSTSCCARLDLRTLSRLFLEFNLCDPEQPRLTRCHVATLSWTRCLTLDTDGYRWIPGLPGPSQTGPRGPNSVPLGDVVFVSVHQLAGAVPGFGQTASTRPCKDLDFIWFHRTRCFTMCHDVSRCVTMCHDVLQFERFSTGTWRRADVQSAHQHKHSDGLRMFEMWTISMQKHAKSPSHGWGSGSPRRCTNWFFLGLALSDSFCSFPVPLLLRQKAVLLLRKHAKKDTKVTNYCIEVLNGTSKHLLRISLTFGLSRLWVMTMLSFVSRVSSKSCDWSLSKHQPQDQQQGNMGSSTRNRSVTPFGQHGGCSEWPEV